MNLAPYWSYYTVSFLAQALGTTMLISIVGLGAGALLGMLIGLARDERINPFFFSRLLIMVLVEVGRRIPFLVFLFIVFFGLQISGWRVGAITAAIAAVSLRAAFYFSESVRAGVQAIPQSQWDAAQCMNVGRFATLRLVVLPQAWPLIAGPGTVLFIQMLKSTAIASQVGVVELTAAAKLLNLRGYSALLCFGTILIAYYFLALGIARLGRLLQQRVNVRHVGPDLKPGTIVHE